MTRKWLIRRKTTTHPPNIHIHIHICICTHRGRERVEEREGHIFIILFSQWTFQLTLVYWTHILCLNCIFSPSSLSLSVSLSLYIYILGVREGWVLGKNEQRRKMEDIIKWVYEHLANVKSDGVNGMSTQLFIQIFDRRAFYESNLLSQTSVFGQFLPESNISPNNDQWEKKNFWRPMKERKWLLIRNIRMEKSAVTFCVKKIPFFSSVCVCVCEDGCRTVWQLSINSYILKNFYLPFDSCHTQIRSYMHKHIDTITPTENRGCSRGVKIKTMDCRIVVNVVVLQSRYYVHFWANTLGKGMDHPILPVI